MEQIAHRVRGIGFAQALEDPVQGLQLPVEGLVLLAHDLGRMAGGQLARLALIERTVEGLLVDVAEAEDLLHRHAVGDQLLLDLDDLVVGHPPQQVDQLGPHLLGGLAGVQLADHVLEQFLAALLLVDQFAHAGALLGLGVAWQ